MIPKRNLKRALSKALSQPGYAVTAFRQRLKSYLSYKYKKGFAAPPETVSIFITYRCNLRCAMCSQWGETGSAKHYTREMLYEQQNLDTLKGLIDDVKGWKPTITLFGGEPLMYKGLFELVGHIKDSGMRCNMITNGVMLHHFAPDIIDSGMDEIIWSLDGPEDIHDQIRGRKGTFKRAVEGMKEIVRLRDEKGLKKPVININSTMFETNYLRMDETIKVAEDVNAKTITFHHLIFIGKEQYLEHDKLFNEFYGTSCVDWSGFIWEGLPAMDPAKIIREVRRLERGNFQTSVHFYPNLPDKEIKLYYSNFDFVPKSYKPRCMSPWMVAYVMPSGEVRPCYLFNYSLGNIKEKPFTQIWNNAQYKRFRRLTKREKIYPVCARCTELYRF
ncbi:MAG: radical SAM protein [Bacteroidetes bacterium]|nr:radical SAM protein [Bacteroidota bacterium]